MNKRNEKMNPKQLISQKIKQNIDLPYLYLQRTPLIRYHIPYRLRRFQLESLKLQALHVNYGCRMYRIVQSF